MRMTVGYKLINMQTSEEVMAWGGVWGQCPSVPNPLILPSGEHICGAQPGEVYEGFHLIPFEMDEPPAPVPESITRRQCALMLLDMALISGPEAIEMTRAGVPPAAIADYFNSLPEASRVRAEIDFAADAYRRDNPLLAELMALRGFQVDDFFREAAKL